MCIYIYIYVRFVCIAWGFLGAPYLGAPFIITSYVPTTYLALFNNVFIYTRLNKGMQAFDEGAPNRGTLKVPMIA